MHGQNGQVMTDLSQFAVKVCGCGVIHFSFGPTTVNLTRDVFLGLYRMLGQVGHDLQNPISQELPNIENVIRVAFGANAVARNEES